MAEPNAGDIDATRVNDTVAKSVKLPSPIALMLDGVDRPPCKHTFVA
jgi:hypothetical protein